MSHSTLHDTQPSAPAGPPDQPDAPDTRTGTTAEAPSRLRQTPYAIENRVARRLISALGDPAIAIALYDGQLISGPAPPVATVVVHDRPTWLRILANPYLQFGEAYSEGRIEVQGDLRRLLESIYHAQNNRRPPGWLRRSRWRLGNMLRSNTLRGSRAHIHHHYDISDDFYRLWLDRDMLYTCAYFPTPEASLEDAQQAKMDYVCRKLRLKPGETVVEAGCGWGALARYMARHYGARVKAYNISHAQIAYARRRAAEEGLDSQVEFIEDDYRNISGRFDVFVSVGMLEHVGPDHYHQLTHVIDRSLDERGRGLLHSIGQMYAGVPINAWIRRRIFPGAYPPAASEMTRLVEAAGFSLLDMENLRLHYAKTLEHWLNRFEASADAVAGMFDQRFVRMWRLYLAGSLASFVGGALHLFQIVFARPACNEIPWTRADLYTPGKAAGE